MQIKIDYQHVLLVIGSAALGGTVAFAESQSPVSLVTALLSFQWKLEQPIVYGFAAGALTSVISTLNKSWGFPDGVAPPTVTSFLPHPADEKVPTK